MKYLILVLLFASACNTPTQSDGPQKVDVRYIGMVENEHVFESLIEYSLSEIRIPEKKLYITLLKGPTYFIGMENNEPKYIFMIYNNRQFGQMIK